MLVVSLVASTPAPADMPCAPDAAGQVVAQAPLHDDCGLVAASLSKMYSVRPALSVRIDPKLALVVEAMAKVPAGAVVASAEVVVVLAAVLPLLPHAAPTISNRIAATTRVFIAAPPPQ